MKIKLSCGLCFFILSFTLSAQFRGGGQADEEKLPEITQSYFIENAHIIPDPNSESFRGSILFEDGLITAVGNISTFPPDAIKINGDSLYVYAGFISGLSHAGIPEKKDERGASQRNDVKDPGNPPNDQAGITPERTLTDLLDPKDKRIAELRNQGFTAVHTVPRGRMLPGQGSLLLLSGDKIEDLIMGEPKTLYAQFRGARRMYPATTIGVIAKWRELYHQSEIAQKHEIAYQKNPKGIQRPSYESPVKAFYPIVNNSLPVIFNTEKILSVHRAIQLQADLGFSMMLANVKQGWQALDAIKEKKFPVFLSLELPKEEEESKKEKDSKKDKKKSKSKKSDDSKIEKSEEQKNFEKRKQAALKDYQSQAAYFEKAGLDFGFSTMDVKAKDIHKNLQKMIENGLSEEQALAALTTYPATVFGVLGSMGTVEKGKLANLTISDQAIFSENASIRYVFVEGQKFEFDKKKKKPRDEKED